MTDSIPEGRIKARQMKLLALLDHGPLIVSDRRRWIPQRIESGPVAFAAARRLIQRGDALLVRKETVKLTRGPRSAGARVAHMLTIMLRQADVI